MKIIMKVDLIDANKLAEPIKDGQDPKLIESFKIFDGEDIQFNEFKNYLFTFPRDQYRNLNNLFETGQTREPMVLIENLNRFRKDHPNFDYITKYLEEWTVKHKNAPSNILIRLRQEA